MFVFVSYKYKPKYSVPDVRKRKKTDVSVGERIKTVQVSGAYAKTDADRGHGVGVHPTRDKFTYLLARK